MEKNKIKSVLFILIGMIISIVLPSRYDFASSVTDSILAYSNRIENDVKKIDFLLFYSETRINLTDTDLIELTGKVLHLAEEINYQFGKAKAYYLLGVFWKNVGEFSKALEYLNFSLDLFKSLNEKQWTGEIYRTIGETYRAAANLELAKKNLYLALRVFTEVKNDTGIAKVYNRFAAVYFEELSSQILDYTKRDTLNPIYYYDSNIKRWFNKILIDTVFYFTQKSNSITEKLNLKNVSSSNYTILSAMLRTLGRFDEAYYNINKALELSKNANDETEIPGIIYNYASIYLEQKRYDEAIKLALEGYQLASKNGLMIYVQLNAFVLSLCYENLGKYKEAYQYSKIVQGAIIHLYQDDIKLKVYSAQKKIINEQAAIKTEHERKIIIYQTIIFTLILVVVLFVAYLLLKKNKDLKIIQSQLTTSNKLIVRQKEELEETNKFKDKLFSIIAHDLKSPFFGLMGYSEIIVEDYNEMSEEEKKELLSEMRESIKEMHSLLNNLLSWGTIQMNKMEFNPKEIELFQVCEKIVHLLKTNAKRKHINIVNQVKEGTLVKGDKEMVVSIIQNLVSNAIKYTNQQGFVHINSEEENDFIKISISDTGIGIREETLKNFFKSKIHFSTKGTEGERGTGLGLIICKEMVEKNDGKIWVTSEINKGTTFYFTLPKV